MQRRAPASDDKSDPFDLTQFLLGRTRAYGLFQDRFGRVRRRFVVTIDGAWDGDSFRLDESFAYDDGVTEQRCWRLTGVRDGQFTATTDDCIGVARGQAWAHETRLRYKMRLNTGKRRITVDFDDRIFEVAPHLAINRAIVRKWGIRVGDVSIVFERG